MTVQFHPEAVEEISAAADYYDTCESGLGLDFLLELEAALHNTSTHPHAWPVLADDIRRTLLHRFPYAILYTIESQQIYVLAVMHLHRMPDYWKTRL